MKWLNLFLKKKCKEHEIAQIVGWQNHPILVKKTWNKYEMVQIIGLEKPSNCQSRNKIMNMKWFNLLVKKSIKLWVTGKCNEYETAKNCQLRINITMKSIKLICWEKCNELGNAHTDHWLDAVQLPEQLWEHKVFLPPFDMPQHLN